MRHASTHILLLVGAIWSARQCTRADAVLDWDALMLDAIRQDTTAPTISTRNLAILHVAIYDAVNSILRTRQPYRFLLESPPDADPVAATIGAGHEIMKVLYPGQQARTDLLYQAGIAQLPVSQVTLQSLAFGADLARRTLTSRQDDGANINLPYIPSDLPGQWRRTPPFFRPPLTPHWRYVDPFCLPDTVSFLPPPPPPLGSPEYAADFNEVKALGGVDSLVRTPYQTETAVFWSDFSYTAMPPGHWHEIAADIARNQNNSLADNALLFAWLSLAHVDAGIVCWEAKYRYNFWRPVTAIHRAEEDGNPATAPDPSWNHLLDSPPFPDHTSGHSTFSAAGAEVLRHFYGTDTLPFTARSDSLPGVVRSYTSLAACTDEIGMSRIYGGIHFQSANRDGKTCGTKVGQYITANYLLPNDSLPTLAFGSRPPATLLIHLHGQVGTALILESTPDCLIWTAISTNLAQSGGVHLQLETSDPSPHFFRIRQQAP